MLATYSHPGETVLDPFCGVGTTLVAATSTGRHAVGLDLNADYVAAARGALASVGSDGTDGAGGGPDSTTGRARMKSAVLRADARTAAALLPPSSIDLVFTSPPYWDMLKQRQARRNRRAKRYIKHNYSTDPHDLSNAITLPEFYGSLRAVFRAVRSVLKPGARCVINIGDYRRRGRFIPLHARCISIMEDLGFELNNIIFWDRRQRYRVGVFGYPNRFMTSNGMVEYLLEFQKPGGRPERGRRAGVS